MVDMREFIRQNLNIREIDSSLDDIEQYFTAISFSPDYIYWDVSNSTKKPRERIIIGAFLDSRADLINQFHKENFWKVGDHLRSLQVKKKYNLEQVGRSHSIFSLIHKLFNADIETEKIIYQDICKKSGAYSNELLIGILVASNGCEETDVCPLLKEKPHWLYNCLNNSVYIDFQTTLIHFRGFGIGTELINRGFEHYRKRFVRASTMTSNPEVMRFHDMLGSYKLATIPMYYPDGATGILYCNQIQNED